MFHRRNIDIGIMLACCIVAFAMAFVLADGRPALANPDGLYALHAAQNLAHGDGLVSRRVGPDGLPTGRPLITKPPLLPVLLAASIKLGFDVKQAAGAIVLLSFSLATGLIYLLARRAVPVGVALLISTLFVALGSQARWAVVIHEEMLLVLLTVASLLVIAVLLERCEKSRTAPRLAWTGLGLMVGAALLASYQGFPLVMTAGVMAAWCGISKLRSIRPLVYYVLGLGIIGGYPFVRFLMLSYSGARPSFAFHAETTWMAMTSGVLNTLQADLLGRLWLWFSHPDAAHIMVNLVAYSLLLGVLLLGGLRFLSLRSACIYVALYLSVFIGTLGAIGVTEVESRALVPVEGVLILIVVVFAYHSVIGKSRRIQFAAAMACLFCLVFYAAGQYGVLREVAIDRREMGSDGNYCHAPKTIAWATENIPPRSVVIAPQCGYQLLADTPQFYWLPIPPADEYRGSEAYNETWGESDFVRISGNTGAKWIVLLRGYRGDPLEDQPGYGAYVTSMFMGEIKSNMIRRVANFPDGSVYSIVGNTSP